MEISLFPIVMLLNFDSYAFINFFQLDELNQFMKWNPGKPRLYNELPVKLSTEVLNSKVSTRENLMWLHNFYHPLPSFDFNNLADIRVEMFPPFD